MPLRGTLAITARGDGARWYARISIPAEAAEKSGWAEGCRLGSRTEPGWLILETMASGRFRLPKATGCRQRRHAFEAAAATLGLRGVSYPQTPIDISLATGCIKIAVEEHLLSDQPAHPSGRKRREAAAARLSPQKRQEIDDSDAPLLKNEKSLRTVTVDELIDFLRREGHRVEQLSQRLWRIDGEVLNGAGMADIANKICARRDLARVVLFF